MGADLYIKCVMADEYENEHRPNYEAALRERDNLAKSLGYNDPKVAEKQELVEEMSNKLWGENPYYFRDSYNDTSLFWQLGLSWWAVIDKLLNEQNASLKPEDIDGIAWETLNVESCKKFLKIVNDSARIWDERISLTYKTIDSQSSYTEWRQYFVDKLTRLREFIQRAIDLEAGIYCSV